VKNVGSEAARAVLLRTERGRERLREERDDRRAPPGSERERKGEWRVLALGWFGPSRPKARGEIDLFFFFKLIFKPSFKLNFE